MGTDTDTDIVYGLVINFSAPWEWETSAICCKKRRQLLVESAANLNYFQKQLAIKCGKVIRFPSHFLLITF